MLEIAGLEKSYGPRRVLKGVDLDVLPGEVCALLGSNGAGKSTLVSVVTGLLPANAGSVRVNGVDALLEHRRVRSEIGLAPQDLGVYPLLSVRANMECFGGLNAVRGRLLQRRISEVATALSLEELLDRRVAELSGGQKRRVHAALAMLHKPSVLFLDEPTVGADVETRAGLLHAVRTIADEGTAVVYTTHYLAEAEDLRASIAILADGRIAERGDLDTIVTRHGHARAELEFSGDAPAMPGWHRSGSRAWLITPDPARAAADAVAALNGDSHRLRTVRAIPASLESAYLAVTGSPITTAEEGDLDACA
ncbi:MAG: ABC transporter ATP-binding protein [Coriobacteriia bacterium]|nr:ABC transporter ATP-binding protein [Coriobacteriia bacterium]